MVYGMVPRGVNARAREPTALADAEGNAHPPLELGAVPLAVGVDAVFADERHRYFSFFKTQMFTAFALRVTAVYIHRRKLSGSW